jgi:uncharacterized protein involved in exopolysaccharide biosynthesis
MRENHFEAREPRHREESSLNGRAADDVWLAVGTLFRWRRFILGVTALIAVVAIVVSLLLPKWYEASARVLPPESGSGGGLAAALLKGPGSAASALFGGAGGDYARYLAILSSRRVLESVVEEFDLVTVYELEDGPHPHEDAIATLEDLVDFPVDNDYEFLSVVVLDQDPERAADMANYMVRRLNDINSELASQNAANYRQFVEMRYDEANAALDSVLDATQAFQKRYGVLDLDVQTQAYFDNLATLQANVTLAEIEYEALRAQFGADNPQVQARREVSQAAARKVRSVLEGREAVLPIAQDEMSDVARDFIDLKREAVVQAQILEAIAPLYEQARFDEEKVVEAVQVVDPAVPPARKAKPKRAVVVITITVTGFLLAVLFVLIYSWWQRRHTYVAHRLRTSVEKSASLQI